MKHVKNLNEWEDHLQMQADQAGMTKEEWIATYGSSIQGIDESNNCNCGDNCTCENCNCNTTNEQKDGGLISDDEDEEMEGLLADVRFMTSELIDHIEKETDRIGGQFRSPGMAVDCKKLIKDIMKKRKFKF